MKDIRFYECSDDWSALYIGGNLVWQGHSGDLTPDLLLGFLKISCKYEWIPSDTRDRIAGEESFRFPASEQTLLDDIEKKNIVDDGFGNAWAKCGHSECDLHVVRPGKVQCNRYCENEETEED
jgi:hypothetical protein